VTPDARFRIGVFALIDDGDRVLLARRRDSGWWNLPGGGMELGETVDEALAREVAEETGLQVRVDRLVGVYSKPQADEVVLTFACSVQGGTLAPTEESSEFGWYAPAAVPERTLPKHAERIVDWAGHVREAIVKAQRAPTLRYEADPHPLPSSRVR